MESSGPSAKTSDSPSHRWGVILGTIIAFMTLVLPVLAIGYYSSSPNSLTPLPQNAYPLSNPGN